MAHSANAVARQLLEMAQQRGLSLTPMQLLKLTYIAHGWMLALYDRPLFSDPVEAWQYGPVIPNLYHAVKGFRGNPVAFISGTSEINLDSDERNIVEQVLEKYGSLSGVRLSSLTHEPGTPWAVVWKPGLRNLVIPNWMIQACYKSLYSQFQASQSRTPPATMASS